MENHTEWVVHDEIPLTTASITKYKAGTNEQRYYNLILALFLTWPHPIYTGKMLLKLLVRMDKVLCYILMGQKKTGKSGMIPFTIIFHY